MIKNKEKGLKELTFSSNKKTTNKIPELKEENKSKLESDKRTSTRSKLLTSTILSNSIISNREIDDNKSDNTIPIYNAILDTVILSVEIPLQEYLNTKEFVYKYNKKPIAGISYLKLKKIIKNNETIFVIQLTFSSKVLLSKYYDGITYNNYKTVKDYINIILKHIVDVDKLTDEDYKIVACHVRNDYPTTDSNYLMNQLSSIVNYNSSEYTRDDYKNESLVFKNKTKTSRIRFKYTIYNKHFEFYKTKNEYFRGYFTDNKLEIMSQPVRFELQLMSPELINYHLFGYKNKKSNKLHSLKEILEPKSIINPIYKIFKDIFPCIERESIRYSEEWIPLMSAVGPQKFINALGIATIPILCEDNTKLTEDVYKGAYKRSSSISKKRRKSLVKSIPSHKPFNKNEYKKIRKTLIERVSTQLDVIPIKSENKYLELENYLKNNLNEMPKYVINPNLK